MKKLFFTTVVLLAAIVAQAQTKIAPKLEKGYKVTYVEETTTNAGGEQSTLTTETLYAVTDVNADGATVEITLTKASEAADDAMGQLQALSTSLVKGITIRVATNADGEVQKILNADEVAAKVKSAADVAIGNLLKENPDLAAAMPKDKLVEQITTKLNEKALLTSLKNSFDVMSLNGKSILNGGQEKFTNEEGMNMKCMYFVAGGKVICSASLNMTKDELKALIIQQVEAEMPEQAEIIKQNIDMVMAQMTFEQTTKATYDFQENGWVKSIKRETKTDMMGQQMQVNAKVTIKQ